MLNRKDALNGINQINKENNMTVTTTTPFPFRTDRTDYINWSQETTGNNILTYAPKNSDELLDSINWAYQNQFRVRPLGHMHNWSPLTIENGQDCSNVLFLDMKRYLNLVSIKMIQEHGIITAQAGVDMETFHTKLEAKKLGVLSTPAPGDLTLGGVLSIGGHGTGIAALGEAPHLGGSFGTLSNSIVSITAVVWNPTTQQYELKTFQRNDQEISAFMVHVGRAFIYEVKMQAPRNRRLRCVSYMDITADEMFSNKPDAQRTFRSFVEQSGRAEAIWFPFTEKPWLKVWTIGPYNIKSKAVYGPFNYPFSDTIPTSISNLIQSINNGNPQLVPTLGQLQYDMVSLGLTLTISSDLWGWSKNLLLYIRPTTLRVTANGYAIVTKRSNIQNVLFDFTEKYKAMVKEYASRGSYPMNNAVEIRVTGLDKADESIIEGAVLPALSPARPVEGKPEWDVVIWLDNLTMPGAPDSNQFYTELETWVFAHFSGDYAETRVEWSKGWGYTHTGVWNNLNVLQNIIPQSFDKGSETNDSWNEALSIFNKYDPHRLFSSPFLDVLLP